MVVITPGAGMFEVDRELATITKLRIVDNGELRSGKIFIEYLVQFNVVLLNLRRSNLNMFI